MHLCGVADRYGAGGIDEGELGVARGSSCLSRF
jgi:hypothetical protein